MIFILMGCEQQAQVFVPEKRIPKKHRDLMRYEAVSM
jgi:hypothetical protein